MHINDSEDYVLQKQPFDNDSLAYYSICIRNHCLPLAEQKRKKKRKKKEISSLFEAMQPQVSVS